MLFVATQTQLEIFILSEMSERERKIQYNYQLYMESKIRQNEPIYETEPDSQTQKTDLWLPKGESEGVAWTKIWGWQMQTITFRMDK